MIMMIHLKAMNQYQSKLTQMMETLKRLIAINLLLKVQWMFLLALISLSSKVRWDVLIAMQMVVQ
jgi:hypothetical protein